MTMKRQALAGAWLVLATAVVWADDPAGRAPEDVAGAVEPPKSLDGGQIVFQLPPERPIDTAPRDFVVKTTWDRNRDSKDSSPIKGARLLSSVHGEARVLLREGERVLRPGDVLGTDTVRSVEPGQVVLERSASAGTGETLVVLAVDGQGRTRFRVYFTKGPDRQPAPTLN
jgi:hypothetical protein